MTVSEAQLSQWLSAGQQALEAGAYLEAAEAFSQLQAALPGVSAIASMAGNAWQLAGRVSPARNAFIEAWRHADEHDIPGVFDLGSSLLALGAPMEAQSCFQRVANARPQDPAAWSALASATRAAGDPIGAWPHIEHALALSPSSPAFLLTAGQVQHSAGDLEGAEAWLTRAAALRPDHAPTRLQQAFTSLLRGITAQGWALFEARPLQPTPAGTRDWHGEPLAGQSILVVSDQGVGDQFHFVRYLSRLRERGAAHVVLSCAPSAVSLFRASGLEAVSPADAPATEWSGPFLSLPHRLAVGSDTASAPMPYLRPSSGLATPSIAPGRVPRVGVVWKGNPDFLSTVLRDFDPRLLPTLTNVPGIEWLSLQYGEAVPDNCPRLHSVPLGGDWDETARVLTTLDAVVSVDTSVAHLAGALGLPGYVLLPHAPDWRWGLTGDRTPWYPSLTLIRQPAPHDWAGVVRHLHTCLQQAFVGA